LDIRCISIGHHTGEGVFASIGEVIFKGDLIQPCRGIRIARIIKVPFFLIARYTRTIEKVNTCRIRIGKFGYQGVGIIIFTHHIWKAWYLHGTKIIHLELIGLGDCKSLKCVSIDDVVGSSCQSFWIKNSHVILQVQIRNMAQNRIL